MARLQVELNYFWTLFAVLTAAQVMIQSATAATTSATTAGSTTSSPLAKTTTVDKMGDNVMPAVLFGKFFYINVPEDMLRDFFEYLCDSDIKSVYFTYVLSDQQPEGGLPYHYNVTGSDREPYNATDNKGDYNHAFMCDVLDLNVEASIWCHRMLKSDSSCDTESACQFYSARADDVSWCRATCLELIWLLAGTLPVHYLNFRDVPEFVENAVCVDGVWDNTTLAKNGTASGNATDHITNLVKTKPSGSGEDSLLMPLIAAAGGGLVFITSVSACVIFQKIKKGKSRLSENSSARGEIEDQVAKTGGEGEYDTINDLYVTCNENSQTDLEPGEEFESSSSSGYKSFITNSDGSGESGGSQREVLGPDGYYLITKSKDEPRYRSDPLPKIPEAQKGQIDDQEARDMADTPTRDPASPEPGAYCMADMSTQDPVSLEPGPYSRAVPGDEDKMEYMGFLDVRRTLSEGPMELQVMRSPHDGQVVLSGAGLEDLCIQPDTIYRLARLKDGSVGLVGFAQQYTDQATAQVYFDGSSTSSIFCQRVFCTHTGAPGAAVSSYDNSDVDDYSAGSGSGTSWSRLTGIYYGSFYGRVHLDGVDSPVPASTCEYLHVIDLDVDWASSSSSSSAFSEPDVCLY